MEGYTKITGCNLIQLAQKAYELSQPQGRGFFHYTPVPLSAEDAQMMVHAKGCIALSMDYAKGRACKLVVHRDVDGDLWVDGERWFDHTAAQLAELRKVWEQPSCAAG